MLLLHVSDIHFRDPLCQTEQDPELYFRDALVSHAAQQASQLGDVDAILVTGDVAFKGIQEEFEAAATWLERLADKVGCNKRRIYVVPGNHDVNRCQFDEDEDARNTVAVIASAGGNEAREKELTAQLEAGDDRLFTAVADFNQFAAKYDCQFYPGRLCWSTPLRIDHRTIVKLYGLNSTLVSGIAGTDHKGELFMGALQLNVSRTPGTVNLVMAHHPPEWMSDQDDIESRLLGAPNIVLFGHRHVRTVFQNETWVENLEAMIERRYANKRDAQKLAAVYVLEEIQSKTARFRQGLVDDTRDIIEQFFEDYDAHMEKFSGVVPGEGWRTPFDAKAVFLGGVAGLGTLGAIGAWAATLGNLGGYIVVSKIAAALGLSSLTAAGAAGPTAVVSVLGGPVILTLGLAIVTGLAVWRLFAGNWRYRLAKKIREVFGKERVLPQLEGVVGGFWDTTVTAFQKGADSLDEAHKKYLEELRAAFGGSQENLRILELRLQRCEELKSFFAAIPWRSDL